VARGDALAGSGALEPVPVTFVSSHAETGGSEHYLELLLGSLDPGWVGGVVALADGPLVGRLRALGLSVQVIETPARLGVLPAALKLRRVLLRQRPAVVHANGVKAALVTVLATPRTGVPVVWVKHDYSWDGWLARGVARRSRQVVAVSEAVTATFQGRLRRRVRVVPNGIPSYSVDRAAGRARLAQLLGQGPHAPAALLVGRLHRAKGQLELVEAVPKVLELRPDTRFGLLGGEDPYHRDYAVLVRRRTAELGLDHAVSVLGHSDEPLSLIAGADLVVVPSVPDERGAGREGCPFALLEAMAVGTPVVGYASGGIPEALGACGELVEEGDRAGLAAAIVRVLNDADLRAARAACGQERVRERHRLDAMVEAMKERYRAAAGSG
jgi:glycosyltransferase involved in cell wall biosynthesis